MQRGSLSEIENNSASEDVELSTSYWSSVCQRLDGAAQDLVSVVLDFQQGLPAADFMWGRPTIEMNDYFVGAKGYCFYHAYLSCDGSNHSRNAWEKFACKTKSQLAHLQSLHKALKWIVAIDLSSDYEVWSTFGVMQSGDGWCPYRACPSPWDSRAEIDNLSDTRSCRGDLDEELASVWALVLPNSLLYSRPKACQPSDLDPLCKNSQSSYFSVKQTGTSTANCISYSISHHCISMIVSTYSDWCGMGKQPNLN